MSFEKRDTFSHLTLSLSLSLTHSLSIRVFTLQKLSFEWCKVHGACPCRSTGWRTDRLRPHSPRRTTFQLVLIDLCGFVRATRTRTSFFYRRHFPPHFLSFFFVAFPSLRLTVYQITRQTYLCPHGSNKVIREAGRMKGVWYGKLLPLSERLCSSHNRRITVCGLVLKWCLTQSIMHYLWWCWCSGLLSNT